MQFLIWQGYGALTNRIYVALIETEESCLSLTGRRKTERYQNIEVEYHDVSFKKQKQKFSGYAAQIIQHEMDHLEGIII